METLLDNQTETKLKVLDRAFWLEAIDLKAYSFFRQAILADPDFCLLSRSDNGPDRRFGLHSEDVGSLTKLTEQLNGERKLRPSFICDLNTGQVCRDFDILCFPDGRKVVMPAREQAHTVNLFDIEDPSSLPQP